MIKISYIFHENYLSPYYGSTYVQRYKYWRCTHPLFFVNMAFDWESGRIKEMECTLGGYDLYIQLQMCLLCETLIVRIGCKI